MPERSADWMAQAERDLEQARWSLEGQFFEWACFIAQQAAEKAVKAVYQAHHAVAWGHAVSKLLADLPGGERPAESLIERAIRLDRFYIPPRYPNGFDVGSPKDYFTRRDAEEAIEDAAQILDFCRRRLS
ncbi:MAG TPA: HEPN domain-containing protein [Anaerolineae bacterium]|nr:HEPN domain-containing protein [Anaerolineae bacterium]